ncbi:MAG: sulfatase [Bacteroidota bacterium]
MNFFSLKLTGIAALSLTSACMNENNRDITLPNVIFIYCDDLGYGDLACYGSEIHKTPNLDRMAEEGMLFTDFHVTSGVCTPSRSSLMTGCYSQRVDMEVNARPWGAVGRQVLFPMAKKGLNPDEITIAELLKQKGYATACIGKWHLGDQAPFLPMEQGFDYYYGIPYSNDMNREYCPLPLMRNNEVIEAPVDQNTITRRYTEEAIKFIAENKTSPFFVYLPHAMTHNPLYAGEKFRGKSENGIYGDAVLELDWSTGQILDYLRENNLAENTLVVFSSDNGAASRWGGSNEPLAGWKGSTLEGGMRVPCIMWLPGTIPANSTSHALTSTMDILPTLANMTGAVLPGDRIIDGHDITEILKGESEESPYNYFYYYQLDQLKAIRKGDYKLHLALDSMYLNIHRATMQGGREMKLVNLKTDLKETSDISDQHPEIVKELMEEADRIRQELGDIGYEGEKVRPAAIVEDPVCQSAKQ